MNRLPPEVPDSNAAGARPERVHDAAETRSATNTANAAGMPIKMRRAWPEVTS